MNNLSIILSGKTYQVSFDQLFSQKVNNNDTESSVRIALENWCELVYPGYKLRKERRNKLKKLYGKN